MARLTNDQWLSVGLTVCLAVFFLAISIVVQKKTRVGWVFATLMFLLGVTSFTASAIRLFNLDATWMMVYIGQRIVLLVVAIVSLYEILRPVEVDDDDYA